MLVYQRVYPINIPLNHYKIPLNHYKIPLNNYKIPLNHYKIPLNHYKIPLSRSNLRRNRKASTAWLSAASPRWRWTAGSDPSSPHRRKGETPGEVETERGYTEDIVRIPFVEDSWTNWVVTASPGNPRLGESIGIKDSLPSGELT